MFYQYGWKGTATTLRCPKATGAWFCSALDIISQEHSLFDNLQVSHYTLYHCVFCLVGVVTNHQAHHHNWQEENLGVQVALLAFLLHDSPSQLGYH